MRDPFFLQQHPARAARGHSICKLGHKHLSSRSFRTTSAHSVLCIDSQSDMADRKTMGSEIMQDIRKAGQTDLFTEKSEKNMSDMFYAVDADHSGQISKEECKSSL